MPSRLPAVARRLALVAAFAGLLAPGAASASPYSATIGALAPTHYLRLSEPAGAVQVADIGVPPPFIGAAWPAWRVGPGVQGGQPGALVGDSDGAMRFAGAGVPGGAAAALISYPEASYLGRQHFSFEAWVKPGVVDSSSRRVISSEDAHGGVLVAARSDGIVFSRYVNPGEYRLWSRTPIAGGPSDGDFVVVAHTVWSTLTAPLVPGRFNHVVANYRLTLTPYPPVGVMELYVNGALAARRRADLMPVLSTNSTTQLTVGSNHSGWLRYDGLLDEVAAYTQGDPLSASAVAAHYRLGSTGSP